MKVRYSYRIYPTSMQQRALAQLFGCVRVVYNDSLALCRMSNKLPKTSELQKVFITLSKKTKGREWLKEVSNIPLQQSINDLGIAFKNFFRGLKTNRKVGFPRFKKRSSQQSARFTRGGFSLKRGKPSVPLRLTPTRGLGKVYLAKIGLLKTKWSRPLPSEPSSVTVIKDCQDRFFLSFVVEIEPISKPALRESIGVDLGIKIFAALSNKEKVYSPNYSRLERKISRTQKQLSRCIKGSNRRENTRLKLARLNAQLADQRKDFLHKLSTRLISENKITVLEDLNVAGMVKNRKLARAISRCGWGLFRTMCDAKSNLYLDREVKVIDRWEPTSQYCSSCGSKWGKLDLSIREVVCYSCNKTHCRDENAAANINNVGVGHIHDSNWTQRERKTASDDVVANLSEASTRKLELNY